MDDKKTMDKKAVAAALSITKRQVETYASQGRLGEVTYIRGRTGRQAVYGEAEVERLKLELESPDRPMGMMPRRDAGAASALIAPADRERFITALEALSKGANRRGAGFGAYISEKIILTLNDAAALTSLSKTSLRKAIKAGKLNAKKIGKGWKIKRSDLNDFAAKL
jgi:excisionase family DNA binding protein